MYKSVLLLFIFPIVFSASVSLESSSEVSNVEEKKKELLNPDGEITVEKKNVDPIEDFFKKAVLVKVDKFLPHDYEFGPPREKLIAIGSRGSINGKSINKRPIVEDELDENTSEIIIEKSVKTLLKDNLSDYSNELKDESIHTQETIVQKSPETEIIIQEESFFNGVIKDKSLDKETTVKIYLDKEEINSEKSLNKQIKIEESLLDEPTSNTRLDLDASIKSDYKEESEKKSDGWKVPGEKFLTEEPIEKSNFLKKSLPISLFSLRKRKRKIREEDNNKLILKKAITKLKFDLPKIDFESLLESSQFRGKSTSTDIDTVTTKSTDVIPSASKSVDVSIPTKSSDVVAPIIKFIDDTISTSTSITPTPETITTTTSAEATSISTPSVATVKSTRQETSRSTTEESTSRSTSEEATLRSTIEEATTTSEEATTKSTVRATTRSPTEVTFRSTTIEKSSRSTTIDATINSTPIKVTSKSTTTESSRRSITIEPTSSSTTGATTKFTTGVTTKSTTETILRSTTIVATTISALRPNKSTLRSTTTKTTTRSTNEEILRSTTKETTLKLKFDVSKIDFESLLKSTQFRGKSASTDIDTATTKSTDVPPSASKSVDVQIPTKSSDVVTPITEVMSRSRSSGVCGEHCGLDGTFSIKSGLDWSHELDSSSALDLFKNVSREIVVDLIRIFKNSSIGSSFRSVHINSIYPVSDLIIVDIYLRLHGINLDVTADDVKAVFSEGLVNSTMGRFAIEESRTEFLVSKDRASRRKVNKLEFLDIIMPDWAWMGIGVLTVSVSLIGILGIVFACNRRNNIRNVSVVSPKVLANIRKKMSLDGICDDSFTEDIIQDIRSSVSACSHLHRASVKRGDIFQDIGSGHINRAFVRDEPVYRSRRGDIIQDIRSSVSGSHLHRASVKRGDIFQDIGSGHVNRAFVRDEPVYRSRSRSEGSGTYLQNVNREKRGNFNRDSYRPRAATDSDGPRAAKDNYGPRDSYRPRAATENYGPRDSYRPKAATESFGPRDSYRTTGYQRGTSRDLLNGSNQQINNAKNIYRRQRQSVSRIPSVSSYNSPKPSVSSYDCRRPSVSSYESRRLSVGSCDSRQQLVSSSDEEVISSNIFTNGSNQRNGNRRGRNDQNRCQVQRQVLSSGDEETVYDSEIYRNEQQVRKVKRFAYTKDSWSGGVYAVPARKRRTPLPGFEIPRWEADLPITPVAKSTTGSSNASGSSLESPSNMVKMLSYRQI